MIPSLYGGNKQGALDALIASTFTESELGIDQRWAVRGGANQTRTNSAGTVVSAVAPRQDCWNLQAGNNNLLLSPDMLDNDVTGIWTRGNCSVVGQGTSTGPWTGAESYKLVEDNTTNFHYILQSASVSGATGDKYTFSVYAKAGERSKFVLQTDNGGNFTVSNQLCTFDLSAVTAVVTGTGASAGTITAVPGFAGWYRCSFTVTAAQAYTGIVWKVYMMNGASSSYLGDGASGMYFQGAMLDVGTALHDFQVSTLGENLAGSHLPSGGNPALWNNPSSLTVTAGGGTFYDGSAADKLTSTGADGFIGTNNFTPLWAAANCYTGSVWMKADAPITVNIYCIDNTGNTLRTCAVTTAWKRFSVTRTLNGAATQVSFQLGGGASLTTGNSVYVYGAQLENSQNAGLLVANSGAPAKRVLMPGLHMGTALTNLIANSTYTSGFGIAFATVTNNTTAAPDGTSAGTRWQEDSNASAQYRYGLFLCNKVANAVYTFSTYVKWSGRRVGIGLQNNSSSSGCEIVFDPSTGQFVSMPTAFGSGFTIGSYGRKYAGNGWWRIWVTASTDATTTQLKSQLVLYNGSSNNYIGNGSSGAYLWGAQTVQANVPDNYIPTSGSVVGTTQDVCTIATANFPSVLGAPYNTTAGTMYWEGYYYGHNNVVTTFSALLGFFNSASRDANSIHFGLNDAGYNAGTAAIKLVVRNSSTSSNATEFTFNKGDKIKIAGSWDGVANTYRYAVSAGGVSFSTSGTPTVAVPTVDTLGVCPQVSFQPVPEAISVKAMYWPRSAPLAELAAMVA